MRAIVELCIYAIFVDWLQIQCSLLHLVWDAEQISIVVVAMNDKRREARFSLSKRVQHFDVLTIYIRFGCFRSIVLLLIWWLSDAFIYATAFYLYAAWHATRFCIHTQFSLLLLHTYSTCVFWYIRFLRRAPCEERMRKENVSWKEKEKLWLQYESVM